MINEVQLLRRYAQEKSDAAFADLVSYRVNFVYAAALRRVAGDTHLAADVTQQVFTALARNARALSRRQTLGGWLFTTTRNISAHLVRSERRRRVREAEAHAMNDRNSEIVTVVDWDRLRPLLDE